MTSSATSGRLQIVFIIISQFIDNERRKAIFTMLTVLEMAIQAPHVLFSEVVDSIVSGQDVETSSHSLNVNSKVALAGNRWPNLLKSHLFGGFSHGSQSVILLVAL